MDGLHKLRKFQTPPPPKRITLGSILSLPLLVFLPWIVLHLHYNPSCSPVSSPVRKRYGGDGPELLLKAMVIADLHLSGPRTVWLDRARRDSFMKASLYRAYETLQPDALLVLGDVSDWGRRSDAEQWKTILRRFNDMIKPYKSLPYHVLAGNHDIGDYYQISQPLVNQFASSFPSLDETGSGAFAIGNLSFISLNAMALACDTCPMHDYMLKVVERAQQTLQKFDGSESFYGPVLLLHLPLYRADESVCNKIDIPKCAPWHEVEGGCSSMLPWNPRPYKLTQYRNMMDMLSPETTNYLLTKLKPNLVLSAHAHHFCDRSFEDGTREITVSTFTWRNRDDPSFLLIDFYNDGTQNIQHCFLARESLTMVLQILQAVVFIILIAVGGVHFCKTRKSLHLKS